MSVPAALYVPDQHTGDRPEDIQYMDEHGLLLHPLTWVDGSPVVYVDMFAAFISANRRNDGNGNWGSAYLVNTSDAGRVMVHVTGDALAYFSECAENALDYPAEDPAPTAPG